IGEALVPDRGQPEDRPRVTGAERANDHIVNPRGVFDRYQMATLWPCDSQLRAGGHRITQKSFPEPRVDPRPGNHAGAVARSDLAFVGVDDRIQTGRVNQPLLYQELLERLNSRSGTVFGGVMVMFAHCFVPLPCGRAPETSGCPERVMCSRPFPR